MKILKGWFIVLVFVCVITTVYVITTSGGGSKVLTETTSIESDDIAYIDRYNSVEIDEGDAKSSTQKPKYIFKPEDIHRQFAFSTDSPQDVLVYIHLQKTGGTKFGENLVKNLDVRNPCKCLEDNPKKCPCFASDGKRQWLYSRYSTGWMCGLHADFTEWNECLKSRKPDQIEGFHRKRRYLLLTMLRVPTERYISEYLHVHRGATWSGATLRCNGKSPTVEEFPLCYRNDSWEGVLLPEFINCPHNLANNRQTRMLANLSLVNCYDFENYSNSTKNQILLRSAIDNLTKLAFFGLKEYVNETQFLFEHTFNIKFNNPLGILKPKRIHGSKEYFDTLKSGIQHQIEAKNILDTELYSYAKQLFFARYEFAMRMVKSRSHS